MRTLGAALAALAVVVVAGCGETGSLPPRTAQWRDCTPDAADAGGQVVARADFLGDHAKDTVRLFGPGNGPCANGLVLRSGSTVEGTDASKLHLDPAKFRVVRLHGSKDSVLVADSRPVPRGGVQTHLFVPSDGALAELTRDGGPLLPFVATDGGGQPATATCEAGGQIAVWTATAHQPPGIVLAWDVRKTSFRIDSGRAVQVSSDLVENGTVDPLMRKKMPQLFEPGAFLRDCSTG